MLLGVALLVAAVYGGYWFYLAEFNSRPPSKDNPMLELGRAALRLELGAQERIAVVPYIVKGADDCRFWTFEAIRSRCDGVGLVVPNFEAFERETVVALAQRIGARLVRPCDSLDVLPAQRRDVVARQLGCGRESKTFTLRVQAFNSERVPSPSGGGSYRHEHIYTFRQQGVI
jgi:hypothetical protein